MTVTPDNSAPKAVGATRKALIALAAIALIFAGCVVIYFAPNGFILNRLVGLIGFLFAFSGTALLWSHPLIQPHTQPFLGPLETNEGQRNFVKWCFDFLKNVIVVGGIKYLAQKTGSRLFETAFQAGTYGLAYLVLTYFMPAFIAAFGNAPPHQDLGRFFLYGGICLLIYFLLAWVIGIAVDQIATAQIGH